MRRSARSKRWRVPTRLANAARNGAIAAAVVALAACATYTPAPIDVRVSAQRFEATRLDDPALRDAAVRALPDANASWPPVSWNRATLLAVALSRNPGLSTARAEINAALAAEITAGESPNPTIGLQSEYAKHEPDQWLYGISFDFLMPVRGVRKLDIELAKLGTTGAKAELMEQTWTVRRDVVGALSDREHARRRADVLARLSAAQERVIAIQHRRIEAGEDAPSDLSTADIARIDIEQQASDAKSDAVAADASLAAALGVSPAALDGVSIEWNDWGDPPPLESDTLHAAREDALLSRADLAVAINAYAEAEAKLERAVARQYPAFDFKPGYYWDHGIAKWPLDVGLTLPLFNRNRGEIAETTAGRDVAGKRMLAVQAGIDGAIEAALRAEDVANANVVTAKKRIDTVHEQLRHADVALRLGAGDSLERDTANALALRSELEAIDARARRQSARNALEDALHRPLSGPELMLAKPAAPESGDNE